MTIRNLFVSFYMVLVDKPVIEFNLALNTDTRIQ
jgi:hypothetical protein